MAERSEELLNVGKRIKQIRLIHKLTQAEFGQIIGKSATTVHGYENGKIIPPTDVILTISSLFHMSLRDIFGLRDDLVLDDGKESLPSELELYYASILKEMGEENE